MKRLDRYLVSVLLLGAVPVLLLLLGLFGFVTLAEELESVGEGRYEDADALRVAMLTLPRIAIDLLPVATLLGGVMALGGLAAEHELTAMRAVGMSQWRLAWPMVIAAGLLASSVLLAQQFGVPVLERDASELRARKLEETVHGGQTTEFWTRSGGHFIRVGEVRFGRQPSDIEIYALGPDHNVQSVVQARSADVLGPGRWLLHEVTESRIQGTSVAQVKQAERVWESFLSAEQMASLVAPVETLTLTELYNYVSYLDTTQLNAHSYRFRLWQVLSMPVGLLAMCLLGLPFVLGSVRAKSAGVRILFGASVGIGFYLVEQTASQLTLLHELPPVLMALLPDSVLLGASVFALTRVE
jgi:lipopolysaccharide export system permease protein